MRIPHFVGLSKLKKMILFNFIIHYWPEIKMGHVDFTSRMNTFLPKDNTSKLISTLKVQISLEFLPLKRIRIPIIKPFNSAMCLIKVYTNLL